jgi:hypothetical protein
VTPPPFDHACWAWTHADQLADLSESQWELVIRQARAANLLARLAHRLAERGLLSQVPEAPRLHLTEMLFVAAAQQREIVREIRLMLDAVRSAAVPVVLLKGAAYLATGLPAAQGRLFSDIDILVPRAALDPVETLLNLHGWMSTHHSAYDQRYYRQWMHELPPMQHSRRQTVLDVHHNILPLTVRAVPDATLLLAAACPVGGFEGAQVLAPVDMVLHSMCHLFHNDDLSHGLRDLTDLDLLLRYFSADPAFWPTLVDRSVALGLQRVLYYGLTSTATLLGTPIPASALAAAQRHAPAAPVTALMRALWRRGLRSPHPTARLRGDAVARFALYLRAHWLRMPPTLLARHLAIKAWMRWRGGATTPTTPTTAA